MIKKIFSGGLIKIIVGCILIGISGGLCYAPLVYLIGERGFKFRYYSDLPTYAAQVAFGLPLFIIGLIIFLKGKKEYLERN